MSLLMENVLKNGISKSYRLFVREKVFYTLVCPRISFDSDISEKK